MSELIKWLSVTDRFSKIFLNKRLEPFHINSSQHMFILEICNFEGMKQEKIPSIVYINKSNVTRALKHLSKVKLIKKKANKEDKRTVRLYPTEQAKQMYPDIVEIEEEWAQVLMKGFSEQEKQDAQSLLRRMGENAVNEFLQNKKKIE